MSNVQSCSPPDIRGHPLFKLYKGPIKSWHMWLPWPSITEYSCLWWWQDLGFALVGQSISSQQIHSRQQWTEQQGIIAKQCCAGWVGLGKHLKASLALVDISIGLQPSCAANATPALL